MMAEQLSFNHCKRYFQNFIIEKGMNIRKTLFAALLASCCLSVSAAEDEVTVDTLREKTVYGVVPGWFVQGQFGAQYTEGEIGFGDLVSPNAQIAVGYNFGKVVAARLAVNAWQSKAGSKITNGVDSKEYKWKWNYVAPSVDVMFNLSNLISGVNPKRLVDVTAFLGVGVNIAFGNNEANSVANQIAQDFPAGLPTSTYQQSQYLRLLWDGTKANVMGRVGAIVDFKVSKHVAVNLELSANTLADNYNSKMAGNTDWYYNALVGAKYTFGKVYKTKKLVPQVKEVVREKIVEKIVEKPVPVVVEEKPKNTIEQRPALHMEIFFNLAGFKLLGSEGQKVKEVANYMKKYPDAKIKIVGLCDKGTGTDAINNPLSQKRSDLVKNILIKQYGIAADRIISEGKGSSIQPYDVPELNRVAICDAE